MLGTCEYSNQPLNPDFPLCGERAVAPVYCPKRSSPLLLCAVHFRQLLEIETGKVEELLLREQATVAARRAELKAE